MADDLVEVRGTFLDASRTPLRGSVIFNPCVSAPLDRDTSPAVVAAIPVTAPLDAAGNFSVLLIPSDDTGWRTDCPIYYEVDIRVSGIRNSYHASIPAPGPWDLTQVIVLDAPPNVAIVPMPGQPGPPGAGGAGFVTDIGSISLGFPTVITHGLSTYDVAIEVFLKDHPGAGPAPGHVVEADTRVLNVDEVSVTISGRDVPTDAGWFRVSVRALGAEVA